MLSFNVKNIKAAFIDFDDTACVHLVHGEYDTDDYLFMDRMPYDDWGSKPLPGLKFLLAALMVQKADIYCLTYVWESLILSLKKRWLDCKYKAGTFTDVIGVSSNEYKLRMIKLYAKRRRIPMSSILVVDDNQGVIELASAEGCVCMTPQEVVARFAVTDES